MSYKQLTLEEKDLVRMHGSLMETTGSKCRMLIPGTKKTRSTESDKLKVGITLRNLTTRRFF